MRATLEHLTARTPARPIPARHHPPAPGVHAGRQDAIEQAHVRAELVQHTDQRPAPGGPAAGVRVRVSRLPEHEPRKLEPECDRVGVGHREPWVDAQQRGALGQPLRRLRRPPSPIRELDRRVVDRRERGSEPRGAPRRGSPIGSRRLALGREHHLTVERDRRDGQAPVRNVPKRIERERATVRPALRHRHRDLRAGLALARVMHDEHADRVAGEACTQLGGITAGSSAAAPDT